MAALQPPNASEHQPPAFPLGKQRGCGSIGVVLKALRQRRLGGWLCLLGSALHLTTAVASPQRGALSTSWSRDAVGRVTSQATGSFSYGSGYDGRHRRTSRSASCGVGWSNLQYDAADRLTSAHLSNGTTLNYAYDNRGNRLAGGHAATTYTVNALNQATARNTSSAGRGYGVYGTVAPGARVRVFHPGTADPEGEELAVDPVTGAYSAWWSAGGAGVTRVELLVRGTLPGGGSQGSDAVSDQAVWVVIPAASEAFVYDDAGRLIEDGTWVYTWNAASHLTGLTRKAGTSADPHVASETLGYSYDADGRRTGRVHTITKTGGQTQVAVSKVLWDGWLPVGEERTLNGVAQARRWFVWGVDVSGSLGGAGGIGGLVSIIEEGGRTLLPVDDGLGNITAVIDAATGNTIARYDYGPYGEIVGESGEVEACPFRYQSKWWDAAAGLNYFGYRHYSPRLGRWISRDPLGEAGGMNLYAYCEGDPVNKHDALGMDVFTDQEMGLWTNHWAVPSDIRALQGGVYLVQQLAAHGAANGGGAFNPMLDDAWRISPAVALGYSFGGDQGAQFAADAVPIVVIGGTVVMAGYVAGPAVIGVLAEGAATVGNVGLYGAAQLTAGNGLAWAGSGGLALWGTRAALVGGGGVAGWEMLNGEPVLDALRDGGATGLGIISMTGYGDPKIRVPQIFRQPLWKSFGYTSPRAFQMGSVGVGGPKIFPSVPRAGEPKPVLLGRFMESRVKPVARAKSFDWYKAKPRGASKADLDQWEINNVRWLLEQVRSGRTIYDIGAPRGVAPGRFVKAERELLHKLGYSMQPRGRIKVNNEWFQLFEWIKK